jgi:flagellar biogenesis protein FliO
MQAHVVVALHKRSVLALSIMTVIGVSMLAWGSWIPSHPPVAAPPSGVEPVAAAAAPTPADTPSVGTSPGRSEFALLTIKTIGSVGLVICLVLAGFMLFRRFAPQYMTKRPGERILRLVEVLPIGDKRSIILMEAGVNKLLLASSPGHISLLSSLPDSATPAATGGRNSAEIVGTGAPSGKFKNLLELEKKAPSANPPARSSLPPDIRGKMQELRKALER